jgi:hypothetical protein
MRPQGCTFRQGAQALPRSGSTPRLLPLPLLPAQHPGVHHRRRGAQPRRLPEQFQRAMPLRLDTPSAPPPRVAAPATGPRLTRRPYACSAAASRSGRSASRHARLPTVTSEVHEAASARCTSSGGSVEKTPTRHLQDRCVMQR